MHYGIFDNTSLNTNFFSFYLFLKNKPVTILHPISDHILFLSVYETSTLILHLEHMGRNARKRVFGVSDKARLKTVSSATETS